MEYFKIFAVMIVFALITGLLAKSKGRNLVLWSVAGSLGVIFTLIGLAFFNHLNKIPEDKRQISIKREKIFCTVAIFLGFLNICIRVFL